MSLEPANNRVLKNTIALYIRMLFVMLISLYTSRIVLDVLGEQDYGIYNVVGGIVVMFAFLSRTLASASQRYFAFELGRKDLYRLNKFFNITLILYLIIVAVIVILAESIGIWYINNVMIIPPERVVAAKWVFQVSVLSFCITILATPFQAIIIANERMGIYAVVGILEASIHLGLILLLKYKDFSIDLLIAYSILMLLNVVINQSIYVFYSRARFKSEVKFKWEWDKGLALEMLSYSWWNIFGAVANIVRSQGINMLLNAFFSPVVNAARGIAYQVNNALNSFANSFYTAVRPQVTKLYAQQKIDSTISLVTKSSKLTFYLLLFLAAPVLALTEQLLGLWLVSVPEYTVLFTRLVIVVALIDSLSHPIMTLAQATGRVALYQIVVSFLIMLILPISWVFLKNGFPPSSALYVSIVISGVCLFARLFIIHYLVPAFSIIGYLRDVLLIISLSAVLTICWSIACKYFLLKSDSVIILLAVFALSVIGNIVIIYLVGMNAQERSLAISMLRKLLKR